MNKSLFLGWVTAVIAMLGSLYFSEIMKFVPCTMCWYQRILMYPLAIILGIAFYKNDVRIYKYVLPLSILGVLISGYHYLHQKVPALKGASLCSGGVPCSGHYINWLGFITIPLLAFTAFVIITVCMFVLRKKQA